MYGAIIGDLAAWTWQHNKEAFYKKLIAEEAPLSEYGATMIAMAKPIFEHQKIGFETLDQMLFGYLWYGTDISNDVKEWIIHHMPCMPFNKVRLIVNIMNALIGWSAESADNAKERARKLVCAFELDKEDYYAAWTLPKLIWALRHGMSKNEALDTIMDFGGDMFVFSPRYTDDIHRITGLPCVIWIENGICNSTQDFSSLDILHVLRYREFKKDKDKRRKRQAKERREREEYERKQREHLYWREIHGEL